MSETWFPVRTTPSGRVAGLRQLSRLTAGLSIGAVAATGVTAVALGVHQLELSGVQLLPTSLLGDLGGGTASGGTLSGGTASGGTASGGQLGGGGSRAVVPAAPSGSGSLPGLVQVVPRGGAHATTGGS